MDRIYISGNEACLADIETFCKEQGISTERAVQAANSLETAGMITVVAIIARYDVIPKCIEAFLKNRKPPTVVKGFIPDKGWVIISGYPAEDAIEIYKQHCDLVIEELPQEPPQEPGEMGFHTGLPPKK